MKTLVLTIILLTLVSPFAGCDSTPPPPPGRIKVKNDTQDKSFNVIMVSGGGVSFYLKPGEAGVLPEGTYTFTLSRRYKDHSRSYTVSCPRNKDKGITVKMIDAHVNRIAGGCKTVGSSKS